MSILLSATGSCAAQTSRQLVGTWQLVSRIDRDPAGHVLSETSLGAVEGNNNSNIGGYTAYFGRYEVDTAAGVVTRQLEGALAPRDVGRQLSRRFRVVGDTLTIQFEPGGPADSRRTRTLIWRRVSS